MKRKFILIISVIIILIISVCVLLLNKSKEVAKNSDEIYINVENEFMAENTNNVTNNIISEKNEEETISTASNEQKVDKNVNQNYVNVNKKVEKTENKNQTSSNSNISKENNAPTGKTTYYIKVNYGANAVTIYKKDENGYYTVPVKAMICSCGTATPKSGVYKTSKGYEWGTLEGGTYGRYSTRIKGGILFHSVPYVSESEDSLEYWEYDKLGTTASLGCVRLAVADSKWIFDNCEVGTQVEFYSDTNPGPLGKPTAQKISDNEKCRNWDPTDTSPNSPWVNGDGSL
mgnify:FL=1